MRVLLMPYQVGSESAKALSNSLEIRRIRLHNSRYNPRSQDVIVNWGNRSQFLHGILDHPRYGSLIHVLNHPSSVSLVSNKLKFLSHLSQNGMNYISVQWTDTLRNSILNQWLQEGHPVYCRTKVQGKGGEGIVIASSEDQLVDAPLYTKGVNNDKEYRVHVFDGKVIDFVRKGTRRGEETRPSSLIRNYAQGWVFIRQGVELPEICEEHAIQAVKACGLHFGAVDICTIKETEETEAKIFEVNSAPGFEYGSTTCNAYANAIKEYIRGL